MARAISHSFAALTREILFLPLEHKIHIFSPLCNILYLITIARHAFPKSGRVSISQSQGPHSHILMTGGGVRRIFLGLTFWPKGIFWGLWKTPGFFWVAKTTEGFFGVLYFSSAQIKNNMSTIHTFVFDQNQSWSWHVLAFQKINNKICWCKNTEGFFWVC